MSQNDDEQKSMWKGGLHKDLPPAGQGIVTAGSVIGIVLGCAAIFVSPIKGMIPGALFGIGGAVLGALIGRGIAVAVFGKKN